RRHAGVEGNLGPGLHGERLSGPWDAQRPFQRLAQRDGVGDVHRLAGHRGFRAVNQDQRVGRFARQQIARVIGRNLDAYARPPGDDFTVQFFVRRDAADDLEVVGIDEAVEEAAALLRPGGVVYDRRDVAHVGVDRKADQEKLHRRYEDGEEQRHRVAANVNRFFAQHRDQAGERVVSDGDDSSCRFSFFGSQGSHNYSFNVWVNVTNTSSSDGVIVLISTSENPSRARSDLTRSSGVASSISR